MIIKNKKKFAVLLFLIMLLSVMPGKVRAAATDNAYDFYHIYGDRVIFQRNSATNGNLYFGMRGKAATTQITYNAIGWKVSIYNQAGTCLQSIYYSLSGSNIRSVDYRQQGDYKYNLYAISLSNIKNRMNATAKNALESGKCNILLDACMIVRIRGNAQGGMNDSGPSWGTVYTTYEGIVNAQDWSSPSRETLKSAFHKSVEGLMHTVYVNKSTGISSVSGGGTYCYGTRVTIQATAATGYRFSHWSGMGRQNSASYSFYINDSVSWTAYAASVQTSVTFHRNVNQSDTVNGKQVYTYGGKGQKFPQYNWKNTGYHAIGWSSVQSAVTAQYTLTCGVSDTWILQNTPSKHLYCVWEPNRYRLVFDGNGADKGVQPEIHTRYDQSVKLPASAFSYGGEGQQYSFLGWSTSPTAVEAEYKQGESCRIDLLVKKLRLENTDNGKITLYAVWDEAPSIGAVDLYYSVEDAREGKITEEEISSHLVARDREDGEISYGRHEENSFFLRDYQAEDYLHFEKDGCVTETCVAIDSSDNRVMRTFTIHLVDTEAKMEEILLGRLRFISPHYYEETDSLSKNSVWRVKTEYRMILEAALELGY